MNNGKLITAADLRSHHINHHQYSTDMEYVKVANGVFRLITSLSGGKYITDEVAKDIAIRLTLHFEDTVADAGIWRGFCVGHHRLYGKWMPFHWNNPDMPIDEITEESCSFIIWMTLTNYDIMRYTNPLMPAVNNLGKAVFAYLYVLFEDMTINEELLDDIYSEVVLSDFYKMRDVLSWLSDVDGCYMTSWDVTADGERQEFDIHSKNLTDYKHLVYEVRCLFPFKEKIGPLALLAQEWYADMLETYNEIDRKAYAKMVREMKFKYYGTYHIENHSSGHFTMKGTDGETFDVCESGFGLGFDKWNEEHEYILTSFVQYQGKWKVNGVAAFHNQDKRFDEIIARHKENLESLELEKSIYQKFIDKNNGQRIYYFHSFKEMKEWHKNIIKTRGIDKLFERFPSHITESNQLLVYLPSDGGMEFAVDICFILCDKNNPFYDEKRSQEESMAIIDSDAVRGENIRYMISNGMLCNLSFPASNDEEKQKSDIIAQENLDFLARYYHRGLY